PLGIVWLSVQRQNDCVGDNVVDEVRAHGARKNREIHLDRRRPKSKYSGSRATVMPLQVHSDIDAEVIEKPRDVPVALGAYIEDRVEGRGDPRPDFAAVMGTVRNSDPLELRAIVQLDQFDGHLRRRMPAEIS